MLLAVLSSFILQASVAETKLDITLQKPLIVKMPQEFGTLAKGDVDGDGRLDLVIADPHHGGVLIFVQRTDEEKRAESGKIAPSARWVPVIENAPFIAKELIIGDDVHAVSIMDFDGDGKADIVYTGKRQGVGVAFQTGKLAWEKVLRYDQCDSLPTATALAVGDLTGDGKADVAALTRDALLIFTGGVQRDLGIPLRLGVANPVANGVLITDVNADGRNDLLFTSNGNGERDLSVRLRSGDGYGPEFAFAHDLTNPQVLTSNNTYITIAKANSGLDSFCFERRKAKSDDPRTLQPAILRPPTNDKSALIATLADMQGKGPELILADPEGSRLFWHQRRSDGTWGEAIEFPSLRGVNSLSAIRLGQHDALVMCSPREKTVGVSNFVDDRLSFPAALPTQSEPQASCVITVGKENVIAVATRDGYRFNLELFKNDAATGWKGSVVKLGSLSRDPSGMIAHDFNGDDAEDLLVLFPREPARVYLQQANGDFKETAEKDAVRIGQTEDLSISRIGFGDFNGDGKDDLLIGGDGYVRALHLEKDGFKLIDQANARNSDEKLRAPHIVDIDGDGNKELLAYEETQGVLEVFFSDGKVFRYKESFATGKINVTNILPLKMSGGFTLAGTREVWNITFAAEQWFTRSQGNMLATYEKASLHTLCAGDFNGDGLVDIAALDGVNNAVDMFTLNKDGSFSHLKTFRVFSDESHGSGEANRGRPNPTSAIAGDFNGDGIDDLVITCHQRLLLYQGSK